MPCNSYPKASSSRLNIFSKQLHLILTSSSESNSRDETYLHNTTNKEGINKVEQNKTKNVRLSSSIAERTRLEIKELTQTTRIIDKVNQHYINK